MRYLVTGGAGFIGSHLCDRMIADGDRVVCLDNFTTGAFENVSHLIGDGLTVVEGSVTELEIYRAAADDVDGIFHMADIVGYANVMAIPGFVPAVGCGGAMVAIAVAQGMGVPLVLASSAEVYGEARAQPFKESDPLAMRDPYKPANIYAWMKGMNEATAASWYYSHRTPVSIARIFNTVGPRQRSPSGFLMPRVMDAALYGRMFTVHGSGAQYRTLGHVKDTVDGLVRIMAHGQRGEAYNVGGTETVTVLDLIHRVEERTGRPVRRVHDPQPYGPGYDNVMGRIPDLTKIRGLGYQPTRTLDDIIEDMTAYHYTEALT